MRRGLVLEGGGAKGAFHCGAVMALYDNGYTFDGVAGTSIGAINGALIVQSGNYEGLFKLWTNVSASLFTDLDDIEVEKLFNRELSAANIAYWSKQALKLIKNIGIPTDKLKVFLNRIISEEQVRNSDIDLAIVTYSLSDRAPVEIFKKDIPEGELTDFILASAYYPAFRLQRLNGKYYIDGGVCNNLPIALLAEKGYEEIIAIRTMSKMPYREPVGTNAKISYICPSRDLGRTVALSQKLINRNIKLGYYDALRFIKHYDGVWFYFDHKEGYLSNYLFNVVKSSYKKFIGILRIDENRATAEEVVACLQKKLLKWYEEYTDSADKAIVMLMEEYAELYGMEEFKIYKAEDFLRELKINYNNAKNNIKDSERIRNKKDNVFKNIITEI